MDALLEAWANLNYRGFDGPYFARSGHLNALKKVLFRWSEPTRRNLFGALDVGMDTHPKMVRELTQRRGIQGCGSESRAVKFFSRYRRPVPTNVETMALLLGAGVVDNGTAPAIAAT